jgi:hypothetical protein
MDPPLADTAGPRMKVPWTGPIPIPLPSRSSLPHPTPPISQPICQPPTHSLTLTHSLTPHTGDLASSTSFYPNIPMGHVLGMPWSGVVPPATAVLNAAAMVNGLMSMPYTCPVVPMVPLGTPEHHEDAHTSLQSVGPDGSTANKMSMRRPWNAEEDRMLVGVVESIGTNTWTEIAKSVPGRTGKQCRERWHNHLAPQIKKSKWTTMEDIMIAQAVAEMGTRWSEIVKRFEGRSDNDIKNRYNANKRTALRRAQKFVEERGVEECTGTSWQLNELQGADGSSQLDAEGSEEGLQEAVKEDEGGGEWAEEGAAIVAPSAAADGSLTAEPPYPYGGLQGGLPETPPSKSSQGKCKLDEQPTSSRAPMAEGPDGASDGAQTLAEPEGCAAAALHELGDHQGDTVDAKRKALLKALGFGLTTAAAAAQASQPKGQPNSRRQALGKARLKPSPKAAKRERAFMPTATLQRTGLLLEQAPFASWPAAYNAEGAGSSSSPLPCKVAVGMWEEPLGYPLVPSCAVEAAGEASTDWGIDTSLLLPCAGVFAESTVAKPEDIPLWASTFSQAEPSPSTSSVALAQSPSIALD